MRNKNVAIIGGGASGLLCAIFCAKASCSVTVFEQNQKCAKKILSSGNGRCNISNTNPTQNDYFGEEPSFVKKALEVFGFDEFEKFCNSVGLLLVKHDDGRVYPLSNESKSVASTFTNYALKIGVKILTDTKIKSAKELFERFDFVVVATGSQAAEHLGGCKDGMDFAKEFGHTISPTYPSLVQLHLNSPHAKKMSGTKTSAEVSLLVNNKKEQSVYGDVLFTNYGISGFGILDISQKASLALLEYAKVEISVNFLPHHNRQKLSSHILNTLKRVPLFTILDVLSAILPLKIAKGIIDVLNIDENLNGAKTDTKLSKKIANQITNWRFEVTSTHGFRHAEVAGGGVLTSEVDPVTMESKKHKNLYFCGEVLDIVGKRGGYNFAWAWASGYSAAKAITEKNL